MDTRVDNNNSSNGPSIAKRGYAMLLWLLVGVVGIVIAIGVTTRERIAANERAWFISRLDSLVPAALHDNDLFADRIAVKSADLLGSMEPVDIYRARRAGVPTAAVLTAVATDGYGGPVHLLVAIDANGTVLGVDVLKHSETPGIGDGFEPRRSNWLQRLVGRSLNNPSPSKWTIQKDGGEFDQFTGSSITPRAILKAVRRALEYFSTHRDLVFSETHKIDAHMQPKSGQ